MNFKEAFQVIGEPEAAECLPEIMFGQTEFNPSFELDLTPEHVRENAEFASIDPQAVERMIQAAGQICRSEALSTVLRALFRGVFEFNGLKERYVPSFRQTLGEFAGEAYLIISSGMIPLVRRMHKEENVPEEITRATCSQVECHRMNHVRGFGTNGVYINQLNWAKYYTIRERLYLRIGRFQYMTERNELPAFVYRKKTNGELIIFAGDGIPFAADGFAVENPADSLFAWSSAIHQENGCVRGHRVLPNGSTEQTQSEISLSDYDIVLEPGMPVLGMHIPPGGNMSPENAEESFRAAKEFYGKRWNPVAIICVSWIFNPNLPEVLPPESNLNKLLRRVHPVPIASDPDSGLWFIFLKGKYEKGAMPSETSLQRAVIDYIDRGNRWRCGGMFLLVDEING